MSREILWAFCDNKVNAQFCEAPSGPLQAILIEARQLIIMTRSILQYKCQLKETLVACWKKIYISFISSIISFLVDIFMNFLLYIYWREKEKWEKNNLENTKKSRIEKKMNLVYKN